MDALADFEMFNDIAVHTNELVTVLVRGEWLLRLVKPSCKWPISSMLIYWRHHAIQFAIDLEITLTIAHDAGLLLQRIEVLQTDSDLKVSS